MCLLLKRPIAGLFVVVSVVLALFWQVRSFEFLNFDDNTYVTENQHVATGLLADNIAWAFSTPYAGHWHPLSWLSHMLDCELFGLDAGAHHLMNVALHAANCGLLFLFVRSLLGRTGVALVVALLFGVHPLRIESVAWVSERKDVLSMLFGLAALNLHLLFVRNMNWAAYGMALVLLGLSLLAKPTFVSMPLLLLLCDAWPLRRLTCSAASIRGALVEKAPFAILSLMFCVVAAYGQYKGGGLQQLSAYPLLDRLAGAGVSYLAYAGKIFMPTGVGIFYPFARYAPGVGAGALLGLIAISALVVSQRRANPCLGWGWAWFLVSALPIVGVVQIGGQAFADRWTYLPSIGLLVAAVVWFADTSMLRCRPRLAYALSLVAVALAAAATLRDLPYWRSSETIFARTLEISPGNFMAHTNLGAALRARGASSKAQFHFEEAVRLNPTYPEALNNLGISRAEQGRYKEAQELFARALAVRPDFAQARYNSGIAFSQAGLQQSTACTSALRE